MSVSQICCRHIVEETTNIMRTNFNNISLSYQFKTNAARIIYHFPLTWDFIVQFKSIICHCIVRSENDQDFIWCGLYRSRYSSSTVGSMESMWCAGPIIDWDIIPDAGWRILNIYINPHQVDGLEENQSIECKWC